MTDKVKVSTCPHPFSAQRIDSLAIEGQSIYEILKSHGVEDVINVRVAIHDEYIRSDSYDRIVQSGDVVTIRVIPSGGGGGKNPLRTVMMIVVIAAAAYVSGGSLGAGAGTWLGVGTTSAALAGAAVSVVGLLAVNSLFPPAAPDMGTLRGGLDSESQVYSISGSRNSISPYGVRPQILGKHRFTPPYGASPYTELVGDDQYLRLLFDCGYGPLTITDLKIGETAIDLFDDVEYQVKEGTPSDIAPTLYTNDIYEEALSINVTQVGGAQTRTTQVGADEISVDISLQGLVQFNDDGSKTERTVNILVQYAPTATSLWSTAGTFSITEKRPTSIRRSMKWAVTTGQYDVKLIRTTPDTDDPKILDDSYWTVLRTIKHITPINLTTKPAQVAIRIKATEQLNGIIDQFNAVFQLRCLDWDSGTSTWVERATSNPASIFRYVLQQAANHRPYPNSLIDLTSLQNWHSFCVSNGFTFNHVKDYRSSIWDTLNTICSAGRASITRIDGRIGVVYDYLKTVPIQHFTPRNSWDFSAKKNFFTPIHAWKIQFINEDEGWREDERIVYDDGYTSANATKFETMSLVGVTDSDLAWKHGRYHIASLRLRPESYSFNVDVEYLVCTRGDLVKISHDVLLVGLGSGRVKSITTAAGYIQTITTDEIFTMESGPTYCIRARQSSGASVLIVVNTVAGDTSTLTLTTPVLIANGPAVGDLVMFGESGSESIDCIIKSIEPSSDLTAMITCADLASAIYSSDSGTIPAYTSPLTAKLTLPDPVIYSVASDRRAMLNNLVDPSTARILVELTPPSGKIETITTIECQYRVTNSVGPWQSQTFSAGTISLYLVNVENGISYDIRVRYLSVALTSGWTYQLDHLVTGLTDAPHMLPRISGLELFGGANTDEFTGSHAKFTWRSASISNSYDIDESGFGIDDGSLDLFFKDYEVRIYDGSTLLRTEYVTDNWYTYIYEKNVEDYKTNHAGVSGAYRTFSIEVYMRGKQNQLSYLPAKMTVTNPAPATPTGISTRASFKTIFLSYVQPTDLDWSGCRVWIGTTPSFTKDATSLAYEGPDTTIVIDALTGGTQLIPGTSYYVAIQAFDGFDYSGSQSVEVEVVTEQVESAEIKELVLDKVLSGSYVGKDFLVGASGQIRSGQTAYNTGNGWWLGRTAGGKAQMSVGSPTGNGWNWDETDGNFYYRGSISISNPADVRTTLNVEDGATAGATWGTNLNSIPATLGSQSSTGLYLSSTYMGFWSTTWKTYIKSDGTFYFSGVDANNYLSYNGTDLTFAGKLNVKSATSGARTEITQDYIKVYDSSGVLRVKLGNLA